MTAIRLDSERTNGSVSIMPLLATVTVSGDISFVNKKFGVLDFEKNKK